MCNMIRSLLGLKFSVIPRIVCVLERNLHEISLRIVKFGGFEREKVKISTERERRREMIAKRDSYRCKYASVFPDTGTNWTRFTNFRFQLSTIL